MIERICVKAVGGKIGSRSFRLIDFLLILRERRHGGQSGILRFHVGGRFQLLRDLCCERWPCRAALMAFALQGLGDAKAKSMPVVDRAPPHPSSGSLSVAVAAAGSASAAEPLDWRKDAGQGVGKDVQAHSSICQRH